MRLSGCQCIYFEWETEDQLNDAYRREIMMQLILRYTRDEDNVLSGFPGAFVNWYCGTRFAEHQRFDNRHKLMCQSQIYFRTNLYPITASFNDDALIFI